MDFSLVIEYQGAVKRSDDSGKGNVNRLKIRAQIGEEDSGIENIEDKIEETLGNQDKLRRYKCLSESSVASDLSTKGKQSKEQVKTIVQSRNTRRSTRLSECSVSSDLNDEKPESVKDMKDGGKLKDSQKKQTQIENFMVPRSKIKSWQDKFGGQEFQANGADQMKSKELSPAIRKTRSGRRISTREKENDLGTPRSLRKRKRSSESSTPISTKKISEESESMESIEINESTKKNLPRIIETEEYIVMSEPSSEGQQGESESSEKIEKSKQSKRR
ncbi:unnamed protein product [Mytilus edulis]|uniref:Uncharacterized protein n=1 Tax=Mytilus edulis TaxID=6550 RepID=A0A8S3UWI0_MYTED|nr:unnamed protein product [Mytilus edulis]